MSDVLDDIANQLVITLKLKSAKPAPSPTDSAPADAHPPAELMQRLEHLAGPLGEPWRLMGHDIAPAASDLSAIRAWAHDNGIPVAARGRIASSVMDQNLAANAT